MIEKRFEVYKVIGSFREWCIEDNVDGEFVVGSIMSKYGADRLCDKLNALNDENGELKSENEKYKNMFFELVETALTDTNCRELYCKGILDIFDNANSLNQARDMIKAHLK